MEGKNYLTSDQWDKYVKLYVIPSQFSTPWPSHLPLNPSFPFSLIPNSKKAPPTLRPLSLLHSPLPFFSCQIDLLSFFFPLSLNSYFNNMYKRGSTSSISSTTKRTNKLLNQNEKDKHSPLKDSRRTYWQEEWITNGNNINTRRRLKYNNVIKLPWWNKFTCKNPRTKRVCITPVYTN